MAKQQDLDIFSKEGATFLIGVGGILLLLYWFGGGVEPPYSKQTFPSAGARG